MWCDAHVRVITRIRASCTPPAACLAFYAMAPKQSAAWQFTITACTARLVATVQKLMEEGALIDGLGAFSPGQAPGLLLRL